VVLLAAILVGASILVVKGAFFTDPSSFPAQVEPAQVSYLDFQSLGSIQTINVALGERVSAGTVLATQSATLDKLRLAYDQSTLGVDTADLASLQATSASPAVQRQQALDLQLAQEGVNAAEVQLTSATTPAEQSLAQTAVAEAETKLALAENSQQLQTSSSVSTLVSAATAAVARDQAAVATDQINIEQAVVTSPSSGVIAGIGGSVGDLAGPDGLTSSTNGPQALPQSPSFQLFPPASQAPASRQQFGFVPLITLYVGGSFIATVQVPQASVGAVHVGEVVRVQVVGQPERLRARVVQTNPQPVIAAGATYYDVLCRLTRSPTWLLAGMTANVTFSSR
jgi:multidrug efflux pump subunit AcrA (membrane-fusion protein)